MKMVYFICLITALSCVIQVTGISYNIIFLSIVFAVTFGLEFYIINLLDNYIKLIYNIRKDK